MGRHQAVGEHAARADGQDVHHVIAAGTEGQGLVAPHPGPLAMAEILDVDRAGQTIIAALVVGAIPLTASWFLIKRINREGVVAVPGSQATPPPSTARGGVSLLHPLNLAGGPAHPALPRRLHRRRLQGLPGGFADRLRANEFPATATWPSWSRPLAIAVVVGRRGCPSRRSTSTSDAFRDRGGHHPHHQRGRGLRPHVDRRPGGRCDPRRRRPPRDEPHPVRLADRLGHPGRPGMDHHRPADHLGDGPADHRQRRRAPLPPGLHLPGDRLWRDHPLLDERQRVLGDRPPVRFTERQPSHLDRGADLELNGRLLAVLLLSKLLP